MNQAFAVQHAYANNTGSTTTVAVTLPNSSTVGNAYLVFVGYASGTATATVADGTNTYVDKGHTLDAGNVRAAYVFVAENVAAAGAGTVTVTATISAPVTALEIWVQEIQNVPTSNVTDVAAQQTAAVTEKFTQSITTLTANDTLFGYTYVPSVGIYANGCGAGWYSATQPDPGAVTGTLGSMVQWKPAPSVRDYTMTAYASNGANAGITSVIAIKSH